MKDILVEAIKEVLVELGVQNPKVELSYPEKLSFGEFTTNIAFTAMRGFAAFFETHVGDIVWLAKFGSIKTPHDFAEKIVSMLKEKNIPMVTQIEVAGPGFINISLNREYYTLTLKEIISQGEKFGNGGFFSGKKIMVEYTQPNPFKPFHIGHLMSNAVGESISRIIESQGANVVRANYQGDVGPHVAKAIYGMMKKGKPEASLSVAKQAEFIGECYSFANNEYESDENIKKEIDQINKKVYEKSDTEINELYDFGRKVTLSAFEEIYTILGTKFDRSFFESETAVLGMKILEEGLEKGVFEKSDGAIVFHGEKFDPKLHTRVFVNSQGLPTYETKELGLTKMKFDLENPDLSVTETAVEQQEVLKVVSKAVEILFPEYAGRIKHITHGMMRFESGKMSSRKGNVITGESLIQDSIDVVSEIMKDRNMTQDELKEISSIVAVSAIKFSILRQAIGGDIIFDFEKSISFEGDSGPYLLYSVTRANSAIEKARKENIVSSRENPKNELSELEQTIGRFPSVVARAGEEYAPHHIVVYLLTLASAFNSFYANNPIAQKENESSPYNLALTEAFVQVMKNGLHLIGVKVPSKM